MVQHLLCHHGVVTVADLGRLGIPRKLADRRTASGHLMRLQTGVWTLAGGPVPPDALLAAACVACGIGSAASHRSAAWWWGLLDHAPRRPEVSVPHGARPRAEGVSVHRSRDLGARWVTIRSSMPVTTPERTLVDLAAVVDQRTLDGAVDVALARRLVDRRRLAAAAGELRRRGRIGPTVLLSALERRGLIDPPAPSVLESRMRRLLRRWAIPVSSVECTVLSGRYRLDFVLLPLLALEVDGYAFHSSPEAKAADSRRRNELRLAGWTVIEADWVTVTRAPHHLREQLEAAVALHRH